MRGDHGGHIHQREWDSYTLLKRIIFALLIATPAFAQQPTAADVGTELLECVSGKVQLRAKIAQLEAEIARLKAPPPEEKKP